jgi:hypothetical protein
MDFSCFILSGSAETILLNWTVLSIGRKNLDKMKKRGRENLSTIKTKRRTSKKFEQRVMLLSFEEYLKLALMQVLGI